MSMPVIHYYVLLVRQAKYLILNIKKKKTELLVRPNCNISFNKPFLRHPKRIIICAYFTIVFGRVFTSWVIYSHQWESLNT